MLVPMVVSVVMLTFVAVAMLLSVIVPVFVGVLFGRPMRSVLVLVPAVIVPVVRMILAHPVCLLQSGVERQLT